MVAKAWFEQIFKYLMDVVEEIKYMKIHLEMTTQNV
jgi:hypothetical protein